MKRVIIELDEEFHKQLKIFCFTNGITLKDYITGCVKRDLEAKNKFLLTFIKVTPKTYIF